MFFFSIGVILLTLYFLVGTSIVKYRVTSLFDFLSLYLLINLYVFTVSYMYLPSNTRIIPVRISQEQMREMQTKEQHEQILSELYDPTNDQNDSGSIEDKRIDTPEDENKLSDRREYEDPEEVRKQ